MNVIFLDIDGVICLKGTKLESSLILNLRKLVEATKSLIVLSSDWRKHPKWFSYLKDQLRMFNFEVFDTTPIFFSNMLRHQEIKRWLEEHKEVEKFAIIDDDVDALIPENPNTFFFMNDREGLTREKANEVIDFLAQKS